MAAMQINFDDFLQSSILDIQFEAEDVIARAVIVAQCTSSVWLSKAGWCLALANLCGSHC